MISVDANLFVYTQDKRDIAKQQSALRVLGELNKANAIAVTLQTLGETYNVLTRRLKMPSMQAATFVRLVEQMFVTIAYDIECVETALTLASDGRFSYWDALLVETLERAGVTHLISEDMQDGFRYKTLEIVTPFAADKSPNRRLMELLTA